MNTYFHADELHAAERIAEAALVVADPVLRDSFHGRTVTVAEVTEHGGAPNPDSLAAAVPADALAFAVFTSGTTGASRLCFHAHGDALHFDRAVADVLSLREGEVCYSLSRMYFAYGLGNSVLLPLQRGATVVLTPQRADAAAALAVLHRHQVSVLYAQPSFYARMLADPHAGRLSQLRLAMVAGEKLPRPVESRLRELLGRRLVNTFGASEIGSTVLADGPEDYPPHSLGRVLAPYGLRVVDEAGEPVPDGAVGRLQICGPTIGPGVRYGSAPPNRLGPDEWFATGDAARWDDGVVWLLGRVDDIEIVAGANVHPTEVEDLITAVVGVDEAAVCAVRRSGGVTSLRAYVVASPEGNSKDELAESIRSTAEAALTWYKVPEDVEFVDALPRNGTGKVLRRTLREWNTRATEGA